MGDLQTENICKELNHKIVVILNKSRSIFKKKKKQFPNCLACPVVHLFWAGKSPDFDSRFVIVKKRKLEKGKSRRAIKEKRKCGGARGISELHALLR